MNSLFQVTDRPFRFSFDELHESFMQIMKMPITFVDRPFERTVFCCYTISEITNFLRRKQSIEKKNTYKYGFRNSVKPAQIRSATMDFTCTGKLGTNVRPLRSRICAPVNFSSGKATNQEIFSLEEKTNTRTSLKTIVNWIVEIIIWIRQIFVMFSIRMASIYCQFGHTSCMPNQSTDAA